MILHFFHHHPAPTEIYTLSLHDALPILGDFCDVDAECETGTCRSRRCVEACVGDADCGTDRKSTRLNSSHGYISYAVFCLKKKIKINLFDGMPVGLNSSPCALLSSILHI